MHDFKINAAQLKLNAMSKAAHKPTQINRADEFKTFFGC